MFQNKDVKCFNNISNCREVKKKNFHKCLASCQIGKGIGIFRIMCYRVSLKRATCNINVMLCKVRISENYTLMWCHIFKMAVRILHVCSWITIEKMYTKKNVICNSECLKGHSSLHIRITWDLSLLYELCAYKWTYRFGFTPSN